MSRSTTVLGIAVVLLGTAYFAAAQTDSLGIWTDTDPSESVETETWGVPHTHETAQEHDGYEFLGRLSRDPYRQDSLSNPYGAGSPYAPNSLLNPYGRYGSPYSPYSFTNPYATKTPPIYGGDGTYLGELSSNPYAPDSISNPYGRYGSPYSPNSIKNPYGAYGSPYSPLSPTNPYATNPPVVLGPKP